MAYIIAEQMAEYLFKQDEARRKIVSFSTDIQGLVPQYLDKILVSHSAVQWGEAGEVYNRTGDAITLSDPLTNTDPGQTIVFRNIDGSVSDFYDITIIDENNINAAGAPAWVTNNIFYTIQNKDTAKEFLVIAIKPNGDTVQIDTVNYDASIYPGYVPPDPPILYHNFDMTITALTTPIFTATGGTLTIDDNGDGTYHVWSEDPVTNVVVPFANRAIPLGVVIHNMPTITSMYYMFRYCQSLEFAHIDAATTSALVSIESAFYNCSALTSLTFNPGFNTSGVVNMVRFVSGSGLTHLDLSTFDFSQPSLLMGYIFDACYSLICITNFDTTHIPTNQRYGIFNGCPVLTAPNATDQNTLQYGAGGLNWVNPSACP